MNETLKTLKERRSCRKYSAKQVEEEALDAILEAGTYAPTGMNRQAPVIVAVQDPQTVKKISKMNAAVMGTENDPFYGAPCVVVVLAEPERYTAVEDGSLVMGTLMNAAYEIGVGSCWIHRARQMFESEEGKELLRKWGLREDLIGVGNCILGYPDEEPAPKPRREGRIIKV